MFVKRGKKQTDIVSYGGSARISTVTAHNSRIFGTGMRSMNPAAAYLSEKDFSALIRKHDWRLVFIIYR